MMQHHRHQFEIEAKNTCLDNAEYFLEDHNVMTEDGYILTLQRFLKRKIPVKDVPEKNTTDGQDPILPEQKPAVLMVHGLFCIGKNWILPEINLPMQLIEQGFDCWLPNLRGTLPSRKHTSLASSSTKYWDFTFHEVAIYDLSAIINYIIDTTGNISLSYVGHSLGCTIFFALLSTRPEYCDKISVGVTLAPACYGRHLRSIFTKACIPILNCLASSKFLRKRPVLNWTISKFVRHTVPKSKRDIAGGWMVRISARIGGITSSKGIDKEMYRRMAYEMPNTASLKLICHTLQCIWADKFQLYDYGRSNNQKIYGQVNPPLYALGNISTPIATFSSKGDHLCDHQDIARLSEQLPNLISHNCIEDEKFAHGDFLFGKNAKAFVYENIIKILTEYKK